MVKLKHPNLGNFGHEGVEYRAVDGVIEVPTHVVEVARCHGYELHVEEVRSDPTSPGLTPEDVKAMDKKALLAYCQENGIDVPAKASVTDLRALVADYEGFPSTNPDA